MSDQRVASRYAKSLLELAVERNVLEQVHEDMLLFSKTVEENRAFQLLLSNPIVKHDKKLAILNGIFKGRVDALTLAFFEIVTRKNRESVLSQVATEFQRQYNNIKGIQEAQIVTATPLTPELRAEFSKMVAGQTGKKVQLKENVNPDLIGGFVLRVGDRQIDSSVRNSIRKLKNNFKENPYITKL